LSSKDRVPVSTSDASEYLRLLCRCYSRVVMAHVYWKPGSIRESVPSASFPTQTTPSTSARPEGPSSHWTVSTTAFGRGLFPKWCRPGCSRPTRATALAANDPARFPRRSVSSPSLVAGSIRSTVLDPASPTLHAAEPCRDSARIQPEVRCRTQPKIRARSSLGPSFPCSLVRPGMMIRGPLARRRDYPTRPRGS
jgi:hypothetical protein